MVYTLDAGNLSEEGLPTGDTAGGAQQRPHGDRTGESLDAGLAGRGEEIDSCWGIYGRIQESTRTGEGCLGVSAGQQPSGANGDNRNGRVGDGAADDQLSHALRMR